MPRKGKRKTVTRNVYLDSGGFDVRVVVGGTAYSARMPLDSTLAELKSKRAELESRGRTDTPRPARHTLQADTPRYLRLVAHLASAKDIAGHLEAWNAALGTIARHRLTPRDVLEVRNAWLAAGLAPKTVNNRVQTLRNLYRRLDGKRATTPCDDLDPLPVPKTIIQRVTDETILAVDLKLQEHELDGKHSVLKDGKTRARFRVFVSTGKRPCEIMRAQPQDVDFEARVWVPRDAKGGYCPGVYLNDDQLAAWRLFAQTNAWGKYNHGNFGRVIRHAGWPATVRPYQARHTMWITAVERGTPLDIVADGAGHKGGGRLTKQFYTGVLNGPLQAMSERMDGRFRGFSVVPASAPSRKRKRD